MHPLFGSKEKVGCVIKKRINNNNHFFKAQDPCCGFLVVGFFRDPLEGFQKGGIRVTRDEVIFCVLIFIFSL